VKLTWPWSTFLPTRGRSKGELNAGLTRAYGSPPRTGEFSPLVSQPRAYLPHQLGARPRCKKEVTDIEGNVFAEKGALAGMAREAQENKLPLSRLPISPGFLSFSCAASLRHFGTDSLISSVINLWLVRDTSALSDIPLPCQRCLRLVTS
jgi:hypothetical protein